MYKILLLKIRLNQIFLIFFNTSILRVSAVPTLQTRKQAIHWAAQLQVMDVYNRGKETEKIVQWRTLFLCPLQCTGKQEIKDIPMLGRLFSVHWERSTKTSLLRRLQAQTLPNATPPLCKIPPMTKIAVTFEPIKRFRCPSRFRIS